jgi:hypothetical protein
VPATAFATIYRRGESFFITSSDQTTVGLWVHSGSVERVDGVDAEAIGSALMRQLDRSTLGVPHPRQDEWTAQRRKALDPLIALAKVRSWRSFIRDATLASVERDGDTIRITPEQSDGQRIGVFTPLTEREQELLSPSEVELGAASVAAVAAEPFDDDPPELPLGAAATGASGGLARHARTAL